MNIIKELRILGKTGFIEKEERNLQQTIIFILKVFVLLIILKLLSTGLLNILDYTDVIKRPNPTTFNRFEDFSLLKIFLITVVYSPMIEELAFRLGLKISKRNLTIMSIALSLIFLRAFLKVEWVFSILISLSFGIITFLALKNNKIFSLTDKLWSTNKRLIFYSFLFVFAFMHLKNYAITFQLILFSPVVFLPMILGGFVLSYVRLKSGIILAIILHSAYNSLPFLIKFLAK